MSKAQAIQDRAKFDFVRYANCWEDPLLLLGAMPARAVSPPIEGTRLRAT